MYKMRDLAGKHINLNTLVLVIVTALITLTFHRMELLIDKVEANNEILIKVRTVQENVVNRLDSLENRVNRLEIATRKRNNQEEQKQP